MRVETVDPDGNGLAGPLPINVVERGDNVAARGILVGRRHCILDIEEDEVGRRCRRLLDHARIGTRDRQLAPLDTRFSQMVKGMTH